MSTSAASSRTDAQQMRCNIQRMIAAARAALKKIENVS
jgi:hypothetical protein